MRRAAHSVVRNQTSRVGSIPAPVGGWNVLDSLAQMDPKDAPILTNYWPTPSDVQTRLGYSNWSTGLPGQVNTLVDYSPYTGTGKLFAASVAGIYDCTAGGAVGAAVVTGLTSTYFQTTQFSTPGGAFLYMVNGVDKPRLYDGAIWVAVDAVSVPAITGVTSTNLIHINSFKSRLFFIEKASMKAWYLPVNSIGGAASQLDFTSIFKTGGYLMAMGTWSLDGGYGMDDYAVWVTSNGEFAVYKGTDPSSASTWALVGVYSLGSPMGRKCFCKYQGDLLYIGKDGVAPLSSSLMSSRVNSRLNITNKIQYAVSAATSSYSNNTGWEMTVYPLDNMLILNIPIGSPSQEQYCMNTITGAWTRFTGWAANTFEVWNDTLYFGGNTIVAKAWNTYADNGLAIQAEAVQAFSYFGSHQNKHFRACRPILTVNGTLGIRVGINTDFDLISSLGSLTFSASPGALWDSALWDVGLWASDGDLKHDWQYIGGMGMAASLHIKTSTNGTYCRWAATDFLYCNAGVI